VRSIAKHYYLYGGVPVNGICPGTVWTNLLDASGWADFPDEFFVPVEKIVEVVLMLVEGDYMMDGKGARISANRTWRCAVGVNGRNHYFREMLEYCDDQMRQVTEATDVDGPALKKVID
jgi:NAD(P)-dependent dehydrogenase (short-subunit alcohol dehydrogenase family)